jgi:hypothetical protein
MADETPDDQLEEVQQRIDEAKRSAEEAIPELDTHERRFYESEPSGEDEDDQTAASPG